MAHNPTPITPTDVCNPVCGACGAGAWVVAYTGPIRDGIFGREVPGRVLRCTSCEVEYLAEPPSLDEAAYRDGTYRRSVGEGVDAGAYFRAHDADLLRIMPLLPWDRLRGLRVADIGCAAGALLDGVSGLARQTIAVEPAEAYHESLRARGHVVYADLDHAVKDLGSGVDLVTSLSVIEHVAEPRRFLAQLRALLAPGGTALISTPNRDDLLMGLGLDAYRRFFYRLVHRYYFTARSLETLARAAGFTRVEFRYHQRFGFENFVGWLHHRRPIGAGTEPPLGASFDQVWRYQLENAARADYLLASLQ